MLNSPKIPLGCFFLSIACLLGPVHDESSIASEPAEEFVKLRARLKDVSEKFDASRKSDVPQKNQDDAKLEYKNTVKELGQEALKLANQYPDSLLAPEILVWIHDGGLGEYSAGMADECDAAYDLLGLRYPNNKAILPVCRIAWARALKTTHAEKFLRNVLDKSSDPDIKGLACLSLARHQHQLYSTIPLLTDQAAGAEINQHVGDSNSRRLQLLDRRMLKKEAAALYQRTISEFGLLTPLGQAFPALGVQASGSLYKLNNLEVGCPFPELEGVDLEGKQINLSAHKGKIVLLVFWATWCGPCMDMVPSEIELVNKMKDKPFILIGVNGDTDLVKARATVTQTGINWSSFQDSGSGGLISTKSGVITWPTTYLLNSQGVVAGVNLRGKPLFDTISRLLQDIK